MEHHRYFPTQQPLWRFKTKLSYCQIWEHSYLHTIAEAYIVDNYDRTHAIINRNKTHLVNSLGHYTDHKTRKTYLLIERIPNRFSEVITLNQSQTLKVLYSVFKGLQELEGIFGFVGLTQSCICFNEAGKVKVWVNPDLGSLHPILSIKQGNLTKIIQNINQIVHVVQGKCFNPTFLNTFIRRLNQHRIINYHQAAQEILKIASNMFIDIEQKPQNVVKDHHKAQQPHHKQNTTRNFEKQYHNTIRHLKNEIIQPIKHKRVNENKQAHNSHNGHFRKFSNHEQTQAKRKRYQSFMQSQVAKKQTNNSPGDLNINLSKFAQSQTYQMIQPIIHKSAPMSPRQTPQQSNKKEHKMEENGRKKQVGYNKKLDVRKDFVFETIKQDNSQCDDSFSQNLKVDQRQIMVSGEFQTFGILQDLSQRSLHKNQSSVNKDSFKKQSQFDIHMMDLQIQKLLQKKSKPKNTQKQKCSIKKIPQASRQMKIGNSKFNQELSHNINKNTVHTENLNNRLNVQGYKNIINECYSKNRCGSLIQDNKQQKQNMGLKSSFLPNCNSSNMNHNLNLNMNMNMKRQKSPSMAYIDIKYEQYIRNKNSSRNHQAQNNNSSNKNNEKQNSSNNNKNGYTASPRIISRHSKHTSNLESQAANPAKMSMNINQNHLNHNNAVGHKNNDFFSTYSFSTIQNNNNNSNNIGNYVQSKVKAYRTGQYRMTTQR